MQESSILIYSIAAVGILSFGLLFFKLRSSFIKSLYDKINTQEQQQGKLINQLAATKTIAKNLEATIANQSKQISEMTRVNTKHTDKLSKTYLEHKKLLKDIQSFAENKRNLEQKVKSLEVQLEKAIDIKEQEVSRIETSYSKVNHSFEILQKSNDNLRQERDFYRDEFTKLRQGNAIVGGDDKITHIKSA